MSSACQKCPASPTVKAHIFPQAALRGIRSRGPDSKVIAVCDDRAMTARNQNGIFDPGILCANCDGALGKLDKWLSESIQQIHDCARHSRPYQPFELKIDPELAIRFSVSVLYRASLSLRSEFQSINLGRYAKVAEEIAFGGDGIFPYHPIVMINVLTSINVDTRQFVFYPVKCSNGNGQYYIFVISGLEFLVKFGGRISGLSSADDPSQYLRLRVGQPVVTVSYPFEESGEGNFLSDIKRRSRQ